jgi:hypothetical protein
MNCPHCQKPIPENNAVSVCPHCGGAAQYPEPPAFVPLPPVKINWFIFFLVLIGPPLLTLITAYLGKDHRGQSVPPFIGFFGGGAAGIACGVMLARRLGTTSSARVLLGILFAGIFAVVCIMLSVLGCGAGGYQVDFR